MNECWRARGTDPSGLRVETRIEKTTGDIKCFYKVIFLIMADRSLMNKRNMLMRGNNKLNISLLESRRPPPPPPRPDPQSYPMVILMLDRSCRRLHGFNDCSCIC